MRRRETLLIIAAAVVLAILAWAILASDQSDAPSGPGARQELALPALRV